jgi:hypothetical protein
MEGGGLASASAAAVYWARDVTPWFQNTSQSGLFLSEKSKISLIE